MTIRSFISIELSDDIRRSMADLIAELRKAGADVTWVPAEKIHLTLKFLGNTDESLIPKIKERISNKLLHYNAFYINISGIGCFPSEKRPRVLWVGIERSDILQSIQKEIDTEVAGLGFAREDRPFSPHLTIGRVRSQKGVAEMLRRFAEFRTTDFGAVEVKSIHIMKSELKPAGAEHTSLAEIPIGRGRKDVEGIEQRTE
ncbi:MAG: RNA 2',3'-cyclic phosphodiesterase [Nitrospirota bacterium]|nr:RNA 2',3'-cyclic phosphodiesterase [Nitrospirota bacterium]